jgi:hypothetical protein
VYLAQDNPFVLNDATEPFWLWISKTTSPLKEKKNICKLYERAAEVVSFYDQYFHLWPSPHILSRHNDGSKDVCNSYKCKDWSFFHLLSTLSPTAVVACTLESSFCT